MHSDDEAEPSTSYHQNGNTLPRQNLLNSKCKKQREYCNNTTSNNFVKNYPVTVISNFIPSNKRNTSNTYLCTTSKVLQKSTLSLNCLEDNLITKHLPSSNFQQILSMKNQKIRQHSQLNQKQVIDFSDQNLTFDENTLIESDLTHKKKKLLEIDDVISIYRFCDPSLCCKSINDAKDNNKKDALDISLRTYNNKKNHHSIFFDNKVYAVYNNNRHNFYEKCVSRFKNFFATFSVMQYIKLAKLKVICNKLKINDHQVVDKNDRLQNSAASNLSLLSKQLLISKHKMRDNQKHEKSLSFTNNQKVILFSIFLLLFLLLGCLIFQYYNIISKFLFILSTSAKSKYSSLNCFHKFNIADTDKPLTYTEMLKQSSKCNFLKIY